MSQKPLISFVIPCYNYAKYLPDCLESIFNQEGDYDFEVLVIDDGSTDNTPEVLSSFSDSRLRIMRHEQNLGHVKTINHGLRQARGDFIARIDPDDRYRKKFLSSTINKFKIFSDVGLVFADASLINEKGEVVLERSMKKFEKDFKGNVLINLLKENFICSSTVIARSRFWQKTLPVPEGLAFHDWYFTLIMARLCDFYYINEVLADYRVHPDNFHSKVVREKKEEASIFWLLSYIFNQKESSPELESEKQKAKPEIYATQYLTLADKYFGFKMHHEARRCYLKAIGYNPKYLLKVRLLRRLIATFIGLKIYDRVKKIFKIALRSN